MIDQCTLGVTNTCDPALCTYAVAVDIWQQLLHLKRYKKIMTTKDIDLRYNISYQNVIVLKVLNDTHSHLCLAGSQSQWSPS